MVASTANRGSMEWLDLRSRHDHFGDLRKIMTYGGSKHIF